MTSMMFLTSSPRYSSSMEAKSNWRLLGALHTIQCKQKCSDWTMVKWLREAVCVFRSTVLPNVVAEILPSPFEDKRCL